MNALPVSNLHRATAFEEELLVVVVYPVYYLGSGGGTDRTLGSKHENVLSNVCAFQRCSAFPCASTADKDFSEPIGLLAFAITPTLSQQRQTSTAFPYLTIIFNYM